MSSASFAERLRAVRERIELACRRAGRDSAEVGLIAVSKTFPAARVHDALTAGQRVFGENRVQEALGKIDDVAQGEWHLIGPLQRNKARHAVGRFHRIHTLDNETLAAELDKRARAADLTQAVLIQVNEAGEESKAGVAPADLDRLVERVLALDALDLRGLMTIPPRAETPEDNRRWFAGLRELRNRCASGFGRDLPELSMGMTGDFEVAVEEGATWIRVGRALFGERAAP